MSGEKLDKDGWTEVSGEEGRIEVSNEEGWIEVRRLAVRCIVGILPGERETEQDLIVTARAWLDLSIAASSAGKMQGGVDYRELSDFITADLKESRYQLLEDLLRTLARRILTRFPAISRLRLKVKKPAALKNASAAAGLDCRRSIQEDGY